MIQFSKEQLQQLQKRYGTDQAIASRLGVTRQAIFKLRKKYELPAIQNRNEKRNREIIHLHSSGITALQLAVKYSLSVAQVYRILGKSESAIHSITNLSSSERVFYDIDQFVDLLDVIRINKRIVTTNGCFDILHSGHLQYLEEAASLGDYLVVAVNSDSSVKALKGPLRPIQTELERATLLAGLKPVDLVIIFQDNTPHKILEAVKPDIHVKGGDYVLSELPERDVVEKNGGIIKLLSFKQGFSTTSVIEKIKNS